MKFHPHLVPALLLLALAACSPGAAEYTESEAPKGLTLDNASAQVDVRFGRGSSRLLPADAARLRALAATGGIAKSDRVLVAAAGSPALAAARFRTIAAELLRYGIVATQRPLVSAARDHAVVESVRYMVTLPACPNWSGPGPHDFTNALHSNFGCATGVNLGLSVASPADLAGGRPVALADGQPAAAAVNRYLNDKVQLPTATTVGPIAASSSATPAAAGASSGSTP
jgi:pilus assembly protein CpaD